MLDAAALRAAREAHEVVVLDVYYPWCTSCESKRRPFAAAAEAASSLPGSFFFGAVDVLEQAGEDVQQIAHALSHTLPNIISFPLNTHASENALEATMIDLVKAMQTASMETSAPTVPDDFEEWLANRTAKDQACTY